MSRNNFSSPPLAGDLPLLPPIVDTIIGSVRAQADSPNSASVRNANVASVGDEYFDSTAHLDFAVCDDFLGHDGNPDKTEITPPSGRCLFTVNEPGAAQITGGDKDEVSASRAILADFPSEIPTVQNRFANQDEALNDEGYDSEGDLPYFADEDADDIEGYDELAIGVDAPTPPPPPPVAPTVITVESLTRLPVKELKEELKKRGRSTTGKKKSYGLA